MRKFFAAILTLIFVILLPIALYAQSIKSTVFKPAFYKSELVKHSIYQKVLDEISRQLFASEMVESMGEIPLFSVDEVQGILEEIITPDWLQENVEMVIDKAFTWFNSDQDIQEVEIIISLVDLKNQAVEILNSTMTKKFDSLPECNPQDLERLSEGFEGGSTCRPLGITADNLRQYIDITEFIDILPDQLDVMGLLSGEVTFGEVEDENVQAPFEADEIFKMLTEWRRMIHLAFLALNFLYVLLAVFFVLIIVLVIKSVRSVIRWAGFNLLISGIILFISALLARDLFERYVLANMEMGGISAVLVSALQSILRDLLTAIIGVIRIEGVIGLVLGFILFAISFIIKKKFKLANHR